MNKPSISIVLPAYNEADYVGDAILSLRTQKYANLEVIVVPNACTDNTAEVARMFADQVIETPVQGISHARNLGYAASKGDIVAFMDSDSRAAPNLLETVAKLCARGYDCGKAKIRPSDDPRLRAVIWCWYVEHVSRQAEKAGQGQNGAGAFLFLTRDLAKRVELADGKLYREDLKVMEDVDLLNRLVQAGKYKFVTESCLYTSMRRFIEEGYIKCFIEDNKHYDNPNGKTRARWNESPVPTMTPGVTKGLKRTG